MKLLSIVLAAMMTLGGCVTSQLRNASLGDLDSAIAIAQNPDFPNPTLATCLIKYRALTQALPTSGGGIATIIAEKEAWDLVDAVPECIIIKAKIQAFFAKFGLVIPIKP